MLDAVDGFRLLDLLHQAPQLRTSPGRPCEGCPHDALSLPRPTQAGTRRGVGRPSAASNCREGSWFLHASGGSRTSTIVTGNHRRNTRQRLVGYCWLRLDLPEGRIRINWRLTLGGMNKVYEFLKLFASIMTLRLFRQEKTNAHAQSVRREAGFTRDRTIGQGSSRSTTPSYWLRQAMPTPKQFPRNSPWRTSPTSTALRWAGPRPTRHAGVSGGPGGKALDDGPHHYIVQFIGPIKASWLTAVAAAGSRCASPYRLRLCGARHRGRLDKLAP